MLFFDDNVQNVIDTTGGLACYYAVDPHFLMLELVTDNGDENVSDSNVHIAVSKLEGLVEGPSNELHNSYIDTESEVTVELRRGCKRQRNETDWKQNMRKRLHDSGLSYVSANGKVVEGKRLKMIKCGNCGNNCNESLPLEMRKEIFHNYWAMADFTGQRDFICAHVLKETLLSNIRKGSKLLLLYSGSRSH